MKMEIDARISAVRPKVAAARKMISQLTPRNEDQRRKSRREFFKWRGKLLSEPRLEGTTPMAWFLSES